MPVLNDICTERLQASEKAVRQRALTPCLIASDGVHMHRAGKQYLNFSGNDYLGLSHHPAVLKAAADALARYGAGATASRLVTGNHPLYDILESHIAHHKQCEAALVFGSGMLANLGVIQALTGEGDLILADKLVHASMIDGARLSGAELKRFAHNDATHLSALLEKFRPSYRNCLILTESVFSMDGDIAPLDTLSALCKTHDAWLMVDDAHGLGIVPQTGASVDIWLGTLSKSLGGYGGYVAGSHILIDYLTSHARALIYTTGLPPATIAAADAALSVLESEPQRGQQALHHAQRIASALGLAKAQSAIVPLIIGESDAALAASQALADEGIWVQAIRPPTVPQGAARLRITTSSAHEDVHISRLIDALKSHRLHV